MHSKAQRPDDYLSNLEPDRRRSMEQLREVIRKNLDPQFEETMNYGMIGYVVPHHIYPPGYHCDPKQPLPFIGLASQKGYISFYHMGIYAQPVLEEWFRKEYLLRNIGKLDMGKSCIRFKNVEKIPFDLMGQLCAKMNVADWIELYTKTFLKKK